MNNKREVYYVFVSLFLLLVFCSLGCSKKEVISNGNEELITPSSGTINQQEGVESKNTLIEEGEKIKIINHDGKVIKEIPLHSEEIIVINDKDLPYQSDGRKRKIKKQIIKKVVLSPNKRYIGIVRNEHDISVILTDDYGKEEEISFEGEGKGQGRLTVYDLDDRVVFDKEMPEGRIIYLSPEPLISDDGKIKVVETMDTLGEAYYDERNDDKKYIMDIIYVYSDKGMELFRIPNKEELEIVQGAELECLSSSGRYLAVTIRGVISGKPMEYVTRFYDIEKRTFWDSTKEYLVWNIKDDGVAKVRDPDTEVTFEINLIQYFNK